MKLTGKLFFSHFLIVAVSVLGLAVSTAYIAPADFSQRMLMGGHIGENASGQRGMMMRGQQSGDGETPGMLMDSTVKSVNDAINNEFRQSLNNALWKAGAVALVAAVVISLVVSRRIVNPIRAVVNVSQRIASGHYDEQIAVHSSDELGELTHQFNRMAAALAQTETMRRQLIGDISHELKTPLASIKGYMEGLQDGVIAATPETFQLIHREASRLQRLVQDLQELSRAEAGQIDIHPKACSPAELIRTAIARLQPQFHDKGITLQNSTPDFLPPVYADDDRVGQVLLNLLGNALQFTPSGGTVTLSAAQRAQMIQFSIQDTGIGLAPEDTQHIFQRFYRADKSRSRKSGGSGIGLTVALHLIEAQGGQLWVESLGLNRGSTFHFTLPLAGIKTPG